MRGQQRPKNFRRLIWTASGLLPCLEVKFYFSRNQNCYFSLYANSKRIWLACKILECETSVLKTYFCALLGKTNGDWSCYLKLSTCYFFNMLISNLQTLNLFQINECYLHLHQRWLNLRGILTLVPLPIKGTKLQHWEENSYKLFTFIVGKFKFSAKGSDLVPFVGIVTKFKIPSEIKPPWF